MVINNKFQKDKMQYKITHFLNVWLWGEINFSQIISTANIKKSQQLLFATYQFRLLPYCLLNNYFFSYYFIK